MAPSRAPTRVPFNDLARHHEPFAEELKAAFERVLGASAFVLGEEVEAFERAFAAFCGVEHCVGVNSGTAALTIMLEAAGIGPGDEIIVPAHTFVATALAVLHVGAVPIAVDVKEATGLIDPDAVAAAIGSGTCGILPVHLYGQLCQMDALRSLAERHGLALFEDAAQAHGACYKGEPAGSLGRAGAFSFYPSKNLGALGDGGAICTDDPDLAERARQLRDLGRSKSGDHALAGYNERLDGLQAAFLSIKLPHLSGWNEARRKVAASYRNALTEIDLLGEDPRSPCIYHLFPIKLRERDLVAAQLRDLGIATGVHYPLALPDQPALRVRAADGAQAAREWAARELSLPIFPEMTEAEVEAVVSGVQSSFR